VITPVDITDKAKRFYPQAIEAWFQGSLDEVFPWRIRANKKLEGSLAEQVQSVRDLREGSKEVRDFGYTVHWEHRKSRTLGDNPFPDSITIDSLDDLLRLISKRTEFHVVQRRTAQLRSTLPELESWLRRSWKKLIRLDAISELIEVVLYLKSHPRPNCFARELPLQIPTKLIENHRSILTEWLDIVLPADSIDSHKREFEPRYGFRFIERHNLARILDHRLQQELGLFTAELSLPPLEIAKMTIDSPEIWIVENQVTLMTLPPIERGIAFFGQGKAVTRLFDIAWFQDRHIHYWGDLDVEGFEILAMLRRTYPKTKSVLMDMVTIRTMEHLATPGTGRSPIVPNELTEAEAEAFLYLRTSNLRIEQEHVPQSLVMQAITLQE
jgi:hypothetical protein